MDMKTHGIPAMLVKADEVLYLRLEIPEDEDGSGIQDVRVWWLEPGPASDGDTLQLTAMAPDRSGPLEDEYLQLPQHNLERKMQ